MPADNEEYFRQRAEAELVLAEAATNAEAARIHFKLAGYYLDRVYNPDVPENPLRNQARA